MEKSFPIHLPSDSSRPNETASSFHVDYFTPIQLDTWKHYQVALREIVIPTSIKGYGESSVICACLYDTRSKAYSCAESKLVKVTVEDFRDVTKILKKLIESLNDLLAKVTVSTGHRCTIDFTTGWDKNGVDKSNFKITLEIPLPVVFLSFPNPPKITVSGVYQGLLGMGENTEYLLSPPKGDLRHTLMKIVVSGSLTTNGSQRSIFYNAPKHMTRGKLRYLINRLNVRKKNLKVLISAAISADGNVHIRFESPVSNIQDVPIDTPLIDVYFHEPLFLETGYTLQNRQSFTKQKLMSTVRLAKKPPGLHITSSSRYRIEPYHSVMITDDKFKDEEDKFIGLVHLPCYKATSTAMVNSLANYAKFEYLGPEISKNTMRSFISRHMYGRTLSFDVKITLKGDGNFLDKAINFTGNSNANIIRHVTKTSDLEVTFDKSTDKNKKALQKSITFPIPMYKPITKGLGIIRGFKVDLLDHDSGKVIEFSDPDMSAIASLHVESIHKAMTPERPLPPEFQITIQTNQDIPLTQPLVLEPGYKVAMTQAVVPYGFVNIHANELWFQVSGDKAGLKSSIRKYIPEGVYSNESFLAYFTIEMNGLDCKVTKTSANFVKIESAFIHRKKWVLLNPAMSAVLGFGGQTVEQEVSRSKILFATNTMDTMRGYQMLVTYCDQIVERERIGNTSASVLGYLTPDYKKAETSPTYTYEPLDVRYKNIKGHIPAQYKLRVDITDTLGRNLEYPAVYTERGGTKPTVDLYFKYFR